MKAHLPRKKIVVVGSSNTDMIIKTPRIPRPGETVLGSEFFMAAGGKGANQAVAAARAGGDVVFIARVGDDMFGKNAVDGFIHDRINVEYVFRDKDTPSGMALIVVDEEGDNSIAVASGANIRLSIGDIERAKPAITSADILLLQLETHLETVKAALRMASSAGVRVILNPAPAQSLSNDILRRISVLTPNETEAEVLTGFSVIKKSDVAKAAEALLSKGVQAVLITIGAQGVYVATSKEKEFVPAFKVKVVDTTAAGDAFNGALAVALAENVPIIDAVRFASAAGAIATTKMGAQPSLPSRAEIESFLSQ